MAPTTATQQRVERRARQAFLVGLGGLPLWWLLGVASFLPVLALPLAHALWTRRRVAVPPRFGWWVLFLLWVMLGAGTLWTTAPGAQDGGGSVLVFGYRLSWYLAASVLLVWLGNTSREWLPDRAVEGLLLWVFVVVTAGGVLGLLAPDLTITTLAERLAPGSLRSNNFVHSLISAEAADVQSVLGGTPRPRPKAPFPFTNTWGSVMTLSLVFLVSRFPGLSVRRRSVLGAAVALASIPIVASLNRGLWFTLAAAATGFLVLLALRHKHAALAALIGIVLAAGVVLTSTPLGTTVADRLDNPHSNERRSQLMVATVDSVTTGSPAVGFGGTRDIEGSFASIAGGSTPECPACGVPPLGTQGQLWLVLFSQGWLGTAFFLTFFLLTLARSWRCRTPNETAATFVTAAFLIQLTVYDTMGLSQLIVMTAIALVWREHRAAGRSPDRTFRPPRPRDVVVASVAAVAGAGLGAVTLTDDVRMERSTIAVELTSTPTYLSTGDGPVTGSSRSAIAPARGTSIDTEAALLRSEAVLMRAGRHVGLDPGDLRSALAVTAPQNSTVLEVSVTTPRVHDPQDAALALTHSYLTERQRFLELRRNDLIGQLQQKLVDLDPADPLWLPTRTYLVDAMDRLRAGPRTVGRVIRSGAPRPVPTDWGVPLTSGAALGLLTGIGAVRVGDSIRRLTWRSA